MSRGSLHFQWLETRIKMETYEEINVMSELNGQILEVQYDNILLTLSLFCDGRLFLGLQFKEQENGC